MDEYAPSTPQTPLLIDGHEPEGGVDYTPGIEYALDGYAPDGETWLRARDEFQASLVESDSVDAAVRIALGSAEEGAESTYDEAEAKFWNYVEGTDGPHAQYGVAINNALDGYAPDGASWLHARDNFFGAIRRGMDVDGALNHALQMAGVGAESPPSDAAERFWSSVHYEQRAGDNYGENTVVVSPDDIPRIDEISPVERPAERELPPGMLTSELSRTGHIEAEGIMGRVEIRGDERFARATPELLSRMGLEPRHRLEVEGRSIWFSQAFNLGKGREAVIGYVTTDEGGIVARSYYRSRSSGSWRYLPQYRYDMESRQASWYSKGYGEESLTLPSALQEGLSRSLEDDGGALEVHETLAQIAFLGTARGIDRNGTVYHRDVSDMPLKVRGIPEDAVTQRGVILPPPDLLAIDPDRAPRFDRPLRAWRQQTDLYGRVNCEVYASADGRFGYTFCRDNRGRAWISSIESLTSPVESTGLRTQWISSVLTTPAYEYAQQARGEGNEYYGNYDDRNGSYVDMYQNYLSHIPVIKSYVAQRMGRRRIG